jgi:ribosomal-protein-alanine N-acetyltransferase
MHPASRSPMGGSVTQGWGEPTSTLFGRRVLLRPLQTEDFDAWREVRRRNVDWLTKWEPERLPGQPDTVEDRDAFAMRCSARQRERQLATGYGFGIFVDGDFAGEINLSSLQRGPFQSCYVGYWVDERHAGRGLVPEALVAVIRFAFDELRLHRLQIAIIPRNTASRRVVEKLDIRDEGTALRYLEINGVWEDHVRYAITAEEWAERGEQLQADWLD